MRDSRERILADPDSYHQQRIERRLPDDFDEMDDDDRDAVVEDLEKAVVSPDPGDLRHEVAVFAHLIGRAV